jgi:uncharacterized protein (TIRG00374 family)
MGRSNHLGEAPTIMGRESMKRGLAGFCVLTVAGLGVLYFVTARENPLAVMENLSPVFLLLAVLATLADWVIGALRYHIFLRRIKPDTPFSVPFKADLVGRFTGAVTPSQTGGGPGQVFMLYRGGIPVPEILSVLMVNFVATLLFFLMVGSAAAWYLESHFSSAAIQHLIQWAFVAFLSGMAFIGLSLTRPDLLARPINRLTRRLEGNPREWARALRKSGDVLVQSAERYRAACVRCIREWPLLPMASLVLTVVLYLNKFTLAWLVVRGLGFEASYGLTLAVQALLHFILYVAPTPGGGGIAELSTAALMAIVLPDNLLGPFTLAYRFFTVYLPASVGAALLVRTLRGRTEATEVDRRKVVARRAAAAILIFSVTAQALHPPPVGAQTVAGHQRITMATVDPLLGSDEARRAEHDQTLAFVQEALMEGVLATSREDSLTAFTLAVDTARALVLSAQDDAEAHYLYAVAMGQRLELAGTREKIRLASATRLEAETALALDPDHAGAHHVLGRLHGAAMRMNSVVRFLAKRLLGAEALEGASWERAEHHFARAHELEPENPRHAMELGVLYLDTDRPEQALEALKLAAAAPTSKPVDAPIAHRVRRLIESLKGT